MATPKTKEEITELSQLVRCYEASCNIKFPTAEELAFRSALQKRLGLGFRLREMRAVSIAGADTPTGGAPARPPGAAGGPRGRA